tara:strand:- start:371 stop:817 length:447 start_codon:yes stop_codon:yes gene_type:complete
MRSDFDAVLTLFDLLNGGVVMVDSSWDEYIPVKLPVDWELTGDVGVHPEIEGVTGLDVTLIIEKKFTRFESLLAKILRAPKVVRRSMHHTQSMLWELIDGNRNFSEICIIMESLYHEDIAPVKDRVRAYLEVFVRLNVVNVFKPREEE